MVLGFAALLFGCYSVTWDTCLDLHREWAIEEADSTVREVPCTPEDTAQSTLVGTLIHLQNCTVTGQKTYTPQTPGLEELSVFEENLPSNMTGVWFSVGVQQNTRRRGSWRSVDRVSNIEALQVVGDDTRIGRFTVSHDMTLLVPGVTVYNLKTAPDYVYEDTGWFGSSPGQLSSKNVQATGAGFLEAKDTLIDFAVGDARVVSVLGALDSNGQLVKWKSSRFVGAGGAQLTQMVRGSVSADHMIRATEQAYVSSKWWSRALDVFFIWYGTWSIVYTPYTCRAWLWLNLSCGCKFQAAQEVAIQYRDRIIVSTLLAVLWSIIPIASAFGLTQLGFRFPVAFLIAGGCLFLIAAFVALCCGGKRRGYTDMDSDESGEASRSSGDEQEDEASAGVTESLYILGLVTASGLVVPLAVSAYFYFRGYA